MNIKHRSRKHLFALALTLALAAAPLEATNTGAEKPRQNAKKARQATMRGLAPCLAWVDADVEPKAAILCVHGLGLHNGSYEHFGKQMATLGFATYSVDVRGFGSWQKAMGRESVDFDDCLKDVADTLKVIRRVHNGLPVFLLGESMGGAIALRVTERFPNLVDGLISCVPSGDRFRQKKTELKVAINFLKGPNKQFDIGSQVIKQASQGNTKLKVGWESDPLARLKLSPIELLQFQRFMNENHDSARNIKDKPVLMVQGCTDKLVKPEGTLELFRELGTCDKQIELINHASHLIFEESQYNDPALNERVIRMIVSWLADHTKRPTETINTTIKSKND